MFLHSGSPKPRIPLSQLPANLSLTIESCDSPTIINSSPQPSPSVATNDESNSNSDYKNSSGDNRPQLFDFSNDNQVLLTARNLELQQQQQQQQQQQRGRLQEPSGNGSAFDGRPTPIFRVGPMEGSPDWGCWGISRATSKTYEILGPSSIHDGEDEAEVSRSVSS